MSFSILSKFQADTSNKFSLLYFKNSYTVPLLTIISLLLSYNAYDPSVSIAFSDIKTVLKFDLPENLRIVCLHFHFLIVGKYFAKTWHMVACSMWLLALHIYQLVARKQQYGVTIGK